MAVLLKNDNNLLPLDPQENKKVLIVGQDRFAERACGAVVAPQGQADLYRCPQPGMQDVIDELGSDATVDLFVVERDLATWMMRSRQLKTLILW